MLFRKIFLIFILVFFTTSVFSDDKMILGLEVFNNKAQCGLCHVLEAANSDGQIGPNLDQLKASIPRIISVVTNGIGVMPPWEDILTDEEIYHDCARRECALTP